LSPFREREDGSDEGNYIHPHAIRAKTSETEPEIVDVYDENGAHIGTGERRAVHQTGAWHRCFHCIIVAHRDEGLELTLQRRGLGLDEYPGLIDVSVAGHLRAGEEVEDATEREIAEEFGIEVSSDRLESLGEYSLVVQKEAMYSREQTDVLLLSDGRTPSAFATDPFDVASVVSMGLMDACELWSGVRSSLKAVEWQSNVGRPILLELVDFVNDVPDYWPWLAAAVARHLSLDVVPKT
jgi:isopentenyldiphosphate isomerase